MKRAEIIGTLYKDTEGDIILLNDKGAHTILIDSDEHLPRKLNWGTMLYVDCHEVDWETGFCSEYWATDIWCDLVEDTRDERGSEVADELKNLITTTFPSVILTYK